MKRMYQTGIHQMFRKAGKLWKWMAWERRWFDVMASVVEVGISAGDM
jgi:hypothetical protein